MRNPFKSNPKEEPTKQNFIVMSSGEFVPENEFRSNIEKKMQTVISSGMSANDDMLASAVSISVPAMVCINYHSNVTSSIPVVVNDEHNKDVDFVPMKHMINNRMRWLIRSVDASMLVWGKAFIRKRYNQGGFPTLLELFTL